VTDRDAAPPEVTVARGGTDAADGVADLWVDLASGQRDHGSHLLAAANREAAREAAARHAVTGGLFLARESGDDDESRLVGFCTADLATGGFETDAVRGVVRNLYVRPPDRGHGIGEALVATAEAHLADRGADVVSLEVLADNEAARRFYRRQGYTPHRVELEKPAGDR
jgi:ribosomal protein S18 acetylase RimI-like enzyme